MAPGLATALYRQFFFSVYPLTLINVMVKWNSKSKLILHWVSFYFVRFQVLLQKFYESFFVNIFRMNQSYFLRYHYLLQGISLFLLFPLSFGLLFICFYFTQFSIDYFGLGEHWER